MRHCTLLFAALATINHAQALVIEARDDRPAFAKLFSLSVWIKLDAYAEIRRSRSEIVISADFTGHQIQGSAGTIPASHPHLEETDIAAAVFLGNLTFERPTDKPRNVVVDFTLNQRSLNCLVKMAKEPPVFEVLWVIDAGLTTSGGTDNVPSDDFMVLLCNDTIGKAGV